MTRKRLAGGGRSEQWPLIEKELADWIYHCRITKKVAVPGKLVRAKALKLFEKMAEQIKENPRYDGLDISGQFHASNGWYMNFCKRYNLVLRKPTHISQKEPQFLLSKIVSHIMRVRN